MTSLFWLKGCLYFQHKGIKIVLADSVFSFQPTTIEVSPYFPRNSNVKQLQCVQSEKGICLSTTVIFPNLHPKLSSAMYLLLLNAHGRLNSNPLTVEVKAGANGRLRSLVEFMDRTDYTTAVRVLDNHFSVEKIKNIKGKPFTLINRPLYAVGKIYGLVENTLNTMN